MAKNKGGEAPGNTVRHISESWKNGLEQKERLRG